MRKKQWMKKVKQIEKERKKERNKISCKIFNEKVQDFA